MQNFEDTYQKFSNLKLLEIIENRENYQPAAVEAAVNVWNNRDISDEEHVALAQQIKSRKDSESQNSVTNKLSDWWEKENESTSTTYFDNENSANTTILDAEFTDEKNDAPYQKGKKIHTGLKIVFSVFILFTLYPTLYFIISSWEYLSLTTLLSFLMRAALSCAALYFFWKKEVIGWQLAVIHSTILLIPSLINLFNLINYYDAASVFQLLSLFDIVLRAVILYFLYQTSLRFYMQIPNNNRVLFVSVLVGVALAMVDSFAVKYFL
jgi:hypothetical protein